MPQSNAVSSPSMFPRSPREAPTIPGLPVIGNLLDAWRDPIEFFTDIATKGDVVAVRFVHLRYFLVNGVEPAHHVLMRSRRHTPIARA